VGPILGLPPSAPSPQPLSIPIANAVPVGDDSSPHVDNEGDAGERLRELERQMRALRRIVLPEQDSGPAITTTTNVVETPLAPNHECTTAAAVTRGSQSRQKAVLWYALYAVGALAFVGIIAVISIVAVILTTPQPVTPWLTFAPTTTQTTTPAPATPKLTIAPTPPPTSKTTMRPVATPSTQPTNPPSQRAIKPVPAPTPTSPPVRSPTVATPIDPKRAQTILDYLNGITLTGQTLSYADNVTAEGRAVQWLIDDDLGTVPSNELALRQRYALATMWHQQGPFNAIEHKATWTNTSLNECEWHDVECGDDDARIVTGLTLQNNGVNGRLPHDLGLLTALTRLELTRFDLYFNGLKGTIPSSLAALTVLSHLDLSFNNLAGTIPSSLAALTVLTHLNLDANSLTGTIPSPMAALTDLQYLALSNNKLDGTIPPSMAALTVLTHLNLYANSLTGTIPSSFAALTALWTLVLSNNQLDGTISSSLAALTNLQYLALTNNQLDGTIPSSLAALTALNELYLENNQLSGTVPFCDGSWPTVRLWVDSDEVSCPCC
jgi:Leucine-rich repeat (LRR) protein